MNHKVIFGDSRQVLTTVGVEDVALTVTSPPYFVGREYETYIKEEDDYWQLMYDVFGLVAQLTEPYGKVVINFPDRYGNSKLFGYPVEVLYAHEFNQIMDSFGFDLWARIIWDKNKVFINGATHLASPTNKTGQMRVAPNWEYIFVWRKHSQPAPVPKKAVDMTREERIVWTDAIWTIDSVTVNEKEKGFKLAKFPEEIPYRFIRMYTEPGDLVLDPFAGACTTTKVAAELGRDSLCIEYNELMEDYIRDYLDGIEVVYSNLNSERNYNEDSSLEP
jgi:site-specific DNA-methyltransferase (adenine-specific)